MQFQKYTVEEHPISELSPDGKEMISARVAYLFGVTRNGGKVIIGKYPTPDAANEIKSAILVREYSVAESVFDLTLTTRYLLEKDNREFEGDSRELANQLISLAQDFEESWDFNREDYMDVIDSKATEFTAKLIEDQHAPIKKHAVEPVNGFAVYINMMCGGPTPVERNGESGKHIVYRTRRAAELSIVDNIKTRLEAFETQEGSFELSDVTSVEDYVEEVDVYPGKSLYFTDEHDNQYPCEWEAGE